MLIEHKVARFRASWSSFLVVALWRLKEPLTEGLQLGTESGINHILIKFKP